jgi:hypothetical protein
MIIDSDSDNSFQSLDITHSRIMIDARFYFEVFLEAGNEAKLKLIQIYIISAVF